MNPNFFAACNSGSHLRRRTLLKAAGLGGLAWLTPVAHLLAAEAERDRKAPAKSVIMLWLGGAPSQLDTFDPHPGADIAAGVKAIDTAAPGIRLAASFPRLAEVMDSVALVRSVVSKEGDHERATYNVKTGFRPDPTLIHPSLGAVMCHDLPDAGAEIPRHISILPGQWPARGGYLGDRFDAYKVYDPAAPVADISSAVSKERLDQRLKDLDVVESAFAPRRLDRFESRTQHRTAMSNALRMMSSEQLKAFDVSTAPKEQRDAYGDTAFGRGCLAAVRLIEVGVRCVEVTLDGWDSHIRNEEIQRSQSTILDPAFASLVRDLKKRGLWEQTIVVCGGEFGRTPTVNPAGGRDHWPHGFSIALAGGPIRGGQAIGKTDPQGSMNVENPVGIADVHATVFEALGINYAREVHTPIGRPMQVCQGKPITGLLRG
jgi:uncharacterized protein (DUF1501 family)